LADIADFVTGFERFQQRYFGGDQSVFARLRQGQAPRAMVISCGDSRADPGMLMGVGPGEIFVVRNVANLVPPYDHDAQMPGVRADIEFAVKSLQVERIIVLGHSGCGGIGALMDGDGAGRYEFIGAWVSIAAEARERVLRELVEAGEMTLHGWYFDLEHGELLEYDAATGKFVALVARPNGAAIRVDPVAGRSG